MSTLFASALAYVGYAIVPAPRAVKKQKPIARPTVVERLPERKNLKSMSYHKICQGTLDWMRFEQGCYGYFLASEIDECIEFFCDSHKIWRPDPNSTRSVFAEMPDVKHGRYRLNQPEFSDVRQRTKSVRPVLYRISSVEELERSQRGPQPAMSGQERHASGSRPSVSSKHSGPTSGRKQVKRRTLKKRPVNAVPLMEAA